LETLATVTLTNAKALALTVAIGPALLLPFPASGTMPSTPGEERARASLAISEEELPPDESREELRRLIEDSRPDLVERRPAVLGPATDEPVSYSDEIRTRSVH
jgi:hypothetical protein